MTKERLKQYKTLRLEEAQLEQELLEHLNSSLIGSAVLDGMPKAGRLADTTASLAMESIRIYARLNAKKLEAVRLRKEIEDCIEGLPGNQRVLMRERYILGRSWEEICLILGYEWRNVHYMHSRALKTLHTFAHSTML